MFNNSTIGVRVGSILKSATKKVTETNGEWCNKLAENINSILQIDSLASVNTAYADIKDVEHIIIKSHNKARLDLIFALAKLEKGLNTFSKFNEASDIGTMITKLCSGLSTVFLTKLEDLNKSINQPKTLTNSLLKKVSQTSGVGDGSNNDKLEKLKSIAKVIVDFCPLQDERALAIIQSLTDMSGGNIDNCTIAHISAIHKDYTQTGQQVAPKDGVLLGGSEVGSGSSFSVVGAVFAARIKVKPPKKNLMIKWYPLRDFKINTLALLQTKGIRPQWMAKAVVI